MGRIWMPGGGGGADLDVVTAEAKDVLAGKVIVDKDGNPLSGTMQTMSGGTYTPSTSQQRISCAEKKMTGDIIIPAFTLPSANVIKKGVTVDFYGKKVTGTWEGYTTSPFYIFNKGTWNGLSSGGMSEVDDPGDRHSLVVGSDIKFTMYMKSNYGCAARTNSMFDFTNYNYLKFVVTNPSNWAKFVQLGISNNANTRSLNAAVNPYSGTVVLNVSALKGWYYIYFVNTLSGTSSDYSGNTYVTVSQIYVSNS